MTDKSKIFLADARRAAERIVALLEPACERIEIAGSIRRQVAIVGDIEIVCQPKLGDGSSPNVSAVDDRVEQLVPLSGNLFGGLSGGDKSPDSGLRFNTENPANGSRYKRLIWTGGPGGVPRMKVDLFCVLPPASWGSLLAIRTGPGDFSRGLVTKRRHGGAMPDGLRQGDGALWDHEHCEKIETPEEADFFAALGLPCWPPEERTAERLEEFLEANAG